MCAQYINKTYEILTISINRSYSLYSYHRNCKTVNVPRTIIARGAVSNVVTTRSSAASLIKKCQSACTIGISFSNILGTVKYFVNSNRLNHYLEHKKQSDITSYRSMAVISHRGKDVILLHRYCFRAISFCFFVSNITRKRLDRFA